MSDRYVDPYGIGEQEVIEDWKNVYKTAKDKAEQLLPSLKLDIKEPPCRHCQHWSPRIEISPLGFYRGIICCTTGDGIKKDFSCYRPAGMEQSK